MKSNFWWKMAGKIFLAIFILMMIFANADLVFADVTSSVAGAGAGALTGTAEEAQIESYLAGQVQKELNPMKFKNVADILNKGTGFFAGVTGSFALVVYIYAGFLWMTAAGSAEKVGKAKTTIIWTTFGVAAVLGSYLLISTVLNWIVGGSS